MINHAQTVTDYDGNEYQTVTIGNQTWMAENLKTTKYNDGTLIPLIIENTAWINLTTPGYCWYDNDSVSYSESYGALYNWYTVNTEKLCPNGWHVPTNSEWNILMDYLGGRDFAGGKMKEAGTLHWNEPNTGATNESGFNGRPGGVRNHEDGNFHSIRVTAYWWTSTAGEGGFPYSYNKYLQNVSSSLSTNTYNNEKGYSVRCMQDTNSVTNTLLVKNDNSRISFYPNPCNGEITIVSENGNIASVEIYTIDGKMVLNRYINSQRNALQINELKKGLYLIKIHENGAISIDKLIIN